MATDGKEHLSLVICGHVDSGKSTTTGRLLFELGGIPERELEKLKGAFRFIWAFFLSLFLSFCRRIFLHTQRLVTLSVCVAEALRRRAWARTLAGPRPPRVWAQTAPTRQRSARRTKRKKIGRAHV